MRSLVGLLFFWFLLVLILGIIVSLVPPGDSLNKVGFEVKLIGGTAVSILLGLILYWRGARKKARGAARVQQV